MAHIIGTSGAWKAVCTELNRVGLHPDGISEIPNLLKVAKEEYQSRKAKCTEEIDGQIMLLKTEIDKLEASFESDLKEYREWALPDLELAQIALQLLLEDDGFIRRLFNYFKIKTARRRFHLLQKEYDSYPKKLQEKINSVKKNYQQVQKNRDALIVKKCAAEKQKVDLLERVRTSPDWAGAVAELEIIDSLRKLPDNCYVLSDVTIELRKAVYFDDAWLRSAQIDHMVICPAGIFVIETKNWSKSFIQDGDYFDPYQQVKRANYLCYKTVGQRYNLRVRSIVAHKSEIPKKPNNSIAKVLPLHEVKGYILWFKETSVTDQTVYAVVNQLARK